MATSTSTPPTWDRDYDVQGFELQVLRGAVELLPAFDDVFAELSFRELYVGQALAGEVWAWLAQRGFVAVAMGRPAVHEHRVVQVDALFSRRSERGRGGS